MNRKVIIIDNDRIGLFDLCSIGVDPGSEGEAKLRYDLTIRYDEVIEGKRPIRKIINIIKLRRKYERNKRRRICKNQRTEQLKK